MKRWITHYWASLAAGSFSLVIYVGTLCPTVYVEGSGELIGASHFLGTPHPTGYPLFCLVGRLFSVSLPFASVAYKINLASAFAGALCVGALSQLFVWRGLNPWIATTTSLVFGFSGTFWSQAVIAEVYTMSTLFAVLTMAFGLRAAENRDTRWFLLTAFAMGVGLTTHLSQALIWPGLLAVLLLKWRGIWRRPFLLLAGAACWALGYSLVVYLLVRNDIGPGFHWGALNTAERLWSHLTGEIYRSSFGSIPLAGALLNLERWLAQIADEFNAPPLLFFCLWGVVAAVRRDRSLLLLAAGNTLANLAAAANYHRDPNGLVVFFIPSILSLGLLLGFGMDDVAGRLGIFRKELRRFCYPVLGLVTCAVVLKGNYYRSDHSENWIAYQYGNDILDTLPPNAVLVADGDDASYLLDYLLRIERRRPDLELFSRRGTGSDLLQDPDRDYEEQRQQELRSRREGELILSRRPVFYLVPLNMPLRGFRFMPMGLCYQAIPNNRHPSRSSSGIDFTNAERVDLFRDPWVRKIQSNYWYMLGEYHRGRQEYEDALAAYEKAAEVAYDSRTVRYNVGLLNYKGGRLQEARRHAEASLEIDPWQQSGAKTLLSRIHKEGVE